MKPLVCWPEMTELERFRAEKDAYFRDDPDSPVYGEAFTELAYYPESGVFVGRIIKRAEQ